jgi:hypothetical protein
VNRHQRRRAQAAARAYDQRLERDRNESLARSRRDIVFECIERLITTNGDHCSLCHASFQHNHRSFGGITGDGVIALVSECCASKLEVTFTSGLYTSRPYADLHERGDGPDVELSSEQIEEAVLAHQRRFAAIDEITDRAARRAGFPAEKMMLRLDDDETIWKADDRTWFENNPTRSHRLRPAFPGEQINGCDEVAPPGHELQIVVRQISPGLRVRVGIFRNLEIDEFPDIEPMTHALFDLVAKREERVSVRELVELARKYDCERVMS